MKVLKIILIIIALGIFVFAIRLIVLDFRPVHESSEPCGFNGEFC